jgi:hypothetical protein
VGAGLPAATLKPPLRVAVSLSTAVPTTPPAVSLALVVSDGVAGLTTSGSTWPPSAAVRKAARSCRARCWDADSWPPWVSPTGF